MFLILKENIFIDIGSQIYFRRFLSFKNFINFKLTPYKSALLTPFFRDNPPKPPFDETFDHIAIIAIANKSFHPFEVKFRLGEVKIKVDIVCYHTFPEELGVAFNSFFVDIVCLIPCSIFHACHFLIEINFSFFVWR